MRLDLYLSKNFDIQSRNKALELILSNKVRVDGKIVSKASFLVDEKMKIELLEEDFYVSRAAYKLKYFLDELKNKNEINLKDKIALDIGSSTGGFTQILLEFDIQKVMPQYEQYYKLVIEKEKKLAGALNEADLR